MLEGISFTVCLGLVWAFTAVIMSRIALTEISIFGFYAVACSLAALATWAMVDWSVVFSGGVSRMPEVILWMGMAGLVNAAGQVCFVSSMRVGHQGITWAVGQSALMFSFLAGVFIWNETAGYASWSGLICVLAAIMLLARRRGGPLAAVQSRRWLPLMFLTFLSLGIGQVLFSVPSRWAGWDDIGHIRGPIVLTTCAFVHVSVVLMRSIRLDMRSHRLSILWAVGAIVSYFTLFKSFDVMAEFGLAGIVYPIAVVTAIVGFSVYTHTRLKEAYTRRELAGMSLAIIGIVLITCR